MLLSRYDVAEFLRPGGYPKDGFTLDVVEQNRWRHTLLSKDLGVLFVPNGPSQ